MSEIQVPASVEKAVEKPVASVKETAAAVEKSVKETVAAVEKTATEKIEEASANPVDIQAQQSVFVQHLSTYPAVTALAGLVASFPVAKIFVSNAVPLLHAIHERTRPVSDPVLRAAEPAFKKADALGDKVLSNLDSRFPQVKTVHPADVYEDAQARIASAKQDAQARIASAKQAAQSQVDQRVVQPVSSVANAAKEQYIKVFDQQGRYVTSILNSSIAPINNKLEGVISEYLPTEKTAEDAANTSASELQRSYLLVKSAAERAQPKIQQAQESSREHVVGVYRQKLAERTSEGSKPTLIGSALALASAGRQLTSEGIASCAHLASLTSVKA